MVETAQGFTFRHQVRVRYAETDAMGVVYHANYLVYFEVARVEYLRSAGTDYRTLEDNRVTAAVVRADVSFLAPARFDDLLTIYTRVREMGRVRFKIEYEIWRDVDRTLIARGFTEHALLSHITLRPVRIPEDVRASIERFEASDGRA